MADNSNKTKKDKWTESKTVGCAPVSGHGSARNRGMCSSVRTWFSPKPWDVLQCPDMVQPECRKWGPSWNTLNWALTGRERQAESSCAGRRRRAPSHPPFGWQQQPRTGRQVDSSSVLPPLTWLLSAVLCGTEPHSEEHAQIGPLTSADVEERPRQHLLGYGVTFLL